MRRLFAALCLLLSVPSRPAAQAGSGTLPIIELRQYTLHPGKRDVLIELFDREFLESQDAVGMKVVGQFRDLDRPDRFVWIRGFADMPSRAEALKAFYSGPVWKANSKAANATMIDSDNVLLLHVARPSSGFTLAAGRPATADTRRSKLVIANTYYFADPAAAAAIVDFFDTQVRPQLKAAGIPVLASFVNETSSNNFPGLPIRENEHVFVWFSSFADQVDYIRHLAGLAKSPGWADMAKALQGKLKAPPEVLRLQPTSRSLVRD